MYLTPVFKLMAEKQASDLFISAGMPISIKILGTIMPVNSEVLDPETVKKIAYEMMPEKDQREFEQNWEMNFSFPVPDVGRFRGLILVVGATGSGKSTTLAAMLEYRNNTRGGHILTIEDPIEFVFKHNRSVINQREVGLDTKSYHNALVNAMREAPDILMIGESRDRETLQQALLYAQTGHLCMSTLHANNSYHALNRIINFFPYDARPALLNDLAVSLKAIISQRLVKAVDGTQVAAVEVLLNSKHIQELIVKAEIDQIKEAIEKSLSPGSTSFEQALFKLYAEGKITKEEALRNSDSATNLAWIMNNAEQAAARVGAKGPINTAAAAQSSSFDDFKIDINAGN
jgi:twitching motility protein PilU